MNRWWCMDCRTAVETDRHGRCGNCGSEAVDLKEVTNELTASVSAAQVASASSQSFESTQ